MRFGYVLCLTLLLASCQTSQTPSPEKSHSLWYNMGLNDAMAGNVVKDNDALVEWSGDTAVERIPYLRGYQNGQAILCHTDQMKEWGKTGKDFPASCDGVENAEQLKANWFSGGSH
ncbi:DUF2799 domain-containing protein [Candidatus Symbiopectobacterium sp. NZEC151]|uniref:DUF2799 domain-containing protein n=1 Tax=Candidatus Symbiopectobacterium sp. NZEC151 TaxID=2820470 RepID=UPI002227B406|nr:DUF2799 domain-containing protein [Candidatus Symbiopectobacterium sp. NZEC151]MCW2477074.1 DUF2799 domain-containing protein [Candidatus Symbiopectobacterium sp. NZEC151]